MGFFGALALMGFIGVVMAMGLGVNTMAHGGATPLFTSNELMRWRVGLQAFALAMLLLEILF